MPTARARLARHTPRDPPTGPLALAALLLSGLLAPVAVSFADDGLLDPSFGVAGRVSVPFDQPGSNFWDRGCSVVGQSDGRSILVGYVGVAGGYRLALTRLLANGALDPSFGTLGKVVLSEPTAGNFDCPEAALQSDGRLVVAGTGFDANPFAWVARLTASGALDTSFSGDGIHYPTTLARATGVLVHPDGTIWLAGIDPTDTFAVLRLTASGTPLAQQGVDFHPGGGGFAVSLALQADGKVLACGYESFSGANLDFAVARFTSGLVLDPTFSSDGKTTIAFDGGGNNRDICYNVAVDAEARIVLLGYAANPDGFHSFALARLTTVGELDATFASGTGQKVIPSELPNGNLSYYPRLALQSDSKPVVASRIPTGDPGNTFDAIVYRLTEAGELDLLFGEGFGGIVFDMAPDGSGVEADYVGTIALHGGRALVVGAGEWNGTDLDFSAARLTGALVFANGFEDGTTFWWSAAVP